MLKVLLSKYLIINIRFPKYIRFKFVFQIGFESAHLKKLHLINDTTVHNCRLTNIVIDYDKRPEVLKTYIN